MCKTEVFVIEGMRDGELVPCAEVNVRLSLLNDDDLEMIRYGLIHGNQYCLYKIVKKDESVDTREMFVRKGYNPSEGYYKDKCGKWAYGTREQATNDIKSRIYG